MDSLEVKILTGTCKNCGKLLEFVELLPRKKSKQFLMSKVYHCFDCGKKIRFEELRVSQEEISFIGKNEREVFVKKSFRSRQFLLFRKQDNEIIVSIPRLTELDYKGLVKIQVNNQIKFYIACLNGRRIIPFVQYYRTSNRQLREELFEPEEEIFETTTTGEPVWTR